MGLINIGGSMPDSARAKDFWIEESDLICASGTSLQGKMFTQILGKLILTKTSLIMLPYEGILLKVAAAAGQRRKNIGN